ncbi:MAG: archaellin/type IV pilin N-terminal domain-containing protein [Candidatus Hodarchaeota archaeon]
MNKKAVSAIIGIILMIAITVAIAATVYVYVSMLLYEEEEVIIDFNYSKIVDKFKTFYPSDNIKYWFIFRVETINETCNCLVDINYYEHQVDIDTYCRYSIGDIYYGKRGN